MKLSDVDLVTVSFNMQLKQFFRVINEDVGALEKAEEDIDQSSERRVRNIFGSGTLVLETEDRTDCGALVESLDSAGLVLVGFFWQKRVDKADKRKRYVALRFTFGRKIRDDAYPKFLELREEAIQFLNDLLGYSFWGVRVHDNPLFVDDEEVEGRRSCSVTFGGRTPKSDRIWKRDEDGEKVGDSAVPIWPIFTLKSIRGQLELVPCEE